MKRIIVMAIITLTMANTAWAELTDVCNNMKSKKTQAEVDAYLGKPVSTKKTGASWTESQYRNSGIAVEVAYDVVGKITYWGCRPVPQAPIIPIQAKSVQKMK